MSGISGKSRSRIISLRTVLVILITSAFILTGIVAFTSRKTKADPADLYKYYTSYEVKSGSRIISMRYVRSTIYPVTPSTQAIRSVFLITRPSAKINVTRGRPERLPLYFMKRGLVTSPLFAQMPVSGKMIFHTPGRMVRLKRIIREWPHGVLKRPPRIPRPS